MAGGTDIMFSGTAMSMHPSDMTVIYTGYGINFKGDGTPLTQGNEFYSNTKQGFIQYTTPSVMELHGLPYEAFGGLNSITYQLSLLDVDTINQDLKLIQCNPWAPQMCRIKVSRDYTPILHGISPQIVYDGSITSFWVDPHFSQWIRTIDNLPFIEARIDGYTVSFDGFVNTQTVLFPSSLNQIRGTAKEVLPSNSSIPNIKFMVGNALHMDSQMTRCDYSNTTCYKVRTVAVINSIDQTKGYTTGGQLITINGYGLYSNGINVTIDGAQCSVQSFSLTQLTCLTGAQSNPSKSLYYVGQHGLRRKYYNTTYSLYFNSMSVSPDYTETLAPDLEAPINLKAGNSGNIYSGYFKAPSSAQFRLYVACDDQCQVYMSNNSDPSQKQLIYTSGWASYRSYFKYDGSSMTQWMNMTKDQLYFIEVRHIQTTATDDVTISLEIQDPSVVPGHQNSMRQVQKLLIYQNLLRDQTNITVTKPDKGQFILNFVPPGGGLWSSAPINCITTWWPFTSAVSGYYATYWGASVSVTVTWFDSTGAVTTNSNSIAKIVYSINVERAISSPSTTQIFVQKVSTAATISVLLPKNNQLSAPPMGGDFQIQCTLADGVTINTTQSIPVGFGPSMISSYINEACPNYVDKYQIWDGAEDIYYADGREIYIRFINLNQDVPLMQIVNSPVTPLTGNQPNFNSSVFIPYSQTNLFYEPMPFEFLYTNESQPQVIVSVGGIPAVCASLNCNFNYIQPSSSITGFTLTGTTLTITGVNLPTSIVTLSLSNIPCTNIIQQGTTSISCSVTPVAGIWQPLLVDSFGIIPVVTTNTIVVSIQISSVTPNQSLNPSGSQTLIISGVNLPQSLSDGTSLLITFSGNSSCNVISTSSTSITCITQSFLRGLITSTMSINVNGVIDSSQTLSISSSPALVVSIVPNQVSPVLKSVLNITVSGFADTLQISDLSVALNLLTGSLYTTAINLNPLYVNIVGINPDNNGNQVLSVVFGGSSSGVYNVSVVSQTYGSFDASSVSLQTIGVVTSFYPQSGSLYGGTLITINGYFFSNDPTDNPVLIGYTDCLVQTSTSTQITCITTPRLSETEGVDDFLVFLKTYEQAVCNMTSCQYTWVAASLPTLNSYSVNFNTTINDYVLSLVGTGFGANMSNTVVLIDNVQQTILQASDTEVDVQIIFMLNSTSLDIDFYLPIGIPQGTDSLTLTNGITLTPQFLSFTPNIGSPAGTLITALIKGVGPLTSGVMLLDQTGKPICSSVNIYNYGMVQCVTKTQTYASQLLSVSVGGQTYSCLDQTGLCNYQTSTTMPLVSYVSVASPQTISFIGTGFSITGFQATVIYAGIAANSVTINSDTSASAIFSYGVPLSSQAITPILYFQSLTSNTTHWASITTRISNALSASSIASPVVCSFAGGCSLTVNQLGLLSSLLYGPNTLTVCNLPCQPNTVLSSASNTVCAIAALPTTYSIENYNISTEAPILGATFSSNNQQTQNVFDGVLTNGWNDNTPNCYFGTSFMPGYVGIIRQVKYFMNAFTASYFIGNLKFQGSNDGVSYTTIFTVGQEIHQGWNYYNYPAGQEPRYRFYRFLGSAYGSCTVGEVVFNGFEAIDNTSSSFSCNASLNLNGTVIPLSGSVTYQGSLTPLLTSISPRFGNVRGGDSVIFTGSNFSPDTTSYNIMIDNRTCTVTSASTTSVTCTTAPRPGLYPYTSLSIVINGMGSVATQGLVFRYCSLWSDPTTWGGEYAPITGDMVVIPPGLHLLVDIDSTPVLSAVLVEGSLIFPPHSDPNHVRTFDAHYVFVDGGYMEVGTEEFPYTSKLIITMWSNKTSPEIPIFGNKVIGVMNGVLDMHGIPRNPTWTEMLVTSQAGSNQITLMTPVDWKAGEVIIIASTDYDHTNAEQMTIASVDNTNPQNPILTLTQPLLNKHYAGIQTFGTQGDFIEMRAEVGLLTRNVVYRGDPGTSAINKFGAHIMLHSSGDESLIGRIEYIELTDVGQAFQLGRYPIHFHLIGTVMNSYVRGNAIHQTYNRALTFHGVFYLTAQHNVVFNTMGHSFFVEDAIEENNLIENNLVISTFKSFSLLQTDQFPASFWITNPNNILRGNHAAGSDTWGFWYDPKANPTGPSYTPTICPNHNALGEFSNNVAHSNGQYGFRIWKMYVPLTYPCNPMIYDPTNLTDPYWQNPLVIANFVNFTTFKNLENGALATDTGAINLVNFKVADSFICGIEFELAVETMDGTTNINGALVIGYTDNAEISTMNTSSFGVITARSENFQVHGVKFYNFDQGDKAAIGSCSHCFFADSTDSGGRTTTFSNLYFDDSTVPLRIRYQFPWKDIFYDLDGSLTGLGPKTWATPFYQHNNRSECSLNFDKFDGLICDSTIQVRRLEFNNFSPQDLVGMDLKILRYDDDEFGMMDNSTQQAYILNSSNYGIIPFSGIEMVWAAPFVTSYKYKLHFEYGVDYVNMEIDLSPHWQVSDFGLDLAFNFSDVRAAIAVKVGATLVPNNTMTLPKSQWHIGDNVVYNDTATRMTHLYIDGSNPNDSSVTMQGSRCIGACLTNIVEATLNSTQILWSSPNSWPGGVVPQAGDNIVINETQNFIYDLVDSPIYNYIEINGAVTFLQTAPRLSLRAYYIFVRAGQFIIGNQSNPFPGEVNITLYGAMEQESIVYTDAIEAGNKIFANTAKVSVFGKKRSQFSRLTQTAMPNNVTVWVAPSLDWMAGDKIAFAPTRMFFNEIDYAIITSYNNLTGQLNLDRPLSWYHFGANQSTGPEYSGVDMRGEVILLSRHIRIVGNDTEAWGCQILTGDFIEGDGIWRNGSTVLDSVEIFNCSQFDTMKGALRFESNGNSWSQISNSAIHHGLGVAVEFLNSGSVLLQNNTIFSFIKYGVNIVTSKNITLDGNIVVGILARHYNLTTVGDIMSGILACTETAGDNCENVNLINNVVAGVENVGVDTTGYTVFAHECGDKQQQVFRNNTAHSIFGYGANVYINEFSNTQQNCMEASFFTAYKCVIAGVGSYSPTNEIIFSNMILIDNVWGAAPFIGQEGDVLWARMNNMIFYGETPAHDCDVQNYCQIEGQAGCWDRTAVIMSQFGIKGKPPMENMPPHCPQWKIQVTSSFGGNILYDNTTFINFTSQTYCGSNQYLLGLSSMSLGTGVTDYQPEVYMTNTKFINIDQDAMTYIYPPQNIWASPDHCGDFACTAPNNVVMSFTGSTFLGQTQPLYTDSDFQIVSSNIQNTGQFKGCTPVSNWNAYYCNQDGLAILLFQSLDADSQTRIVSPIVVTGVNNSARNVLNTFSDHMWDGFYAGQIRYSRFPALIQMGNNYVYNISYTGTPPSVQQFSLRKTPGSVIVSIQYPKPDVYIVKDFYGNVIPANAWDNNIGAPGAIKGDNGGSCGENRYVGVVNVLQFYLKNGCNITISPIDSIQVQVRLNWTLNAFFASGGTTKFTDRLAASLGIQAGQIKVVSVYEGSVVVVTQVIADNSSKATNTSSNLTAIQSTLISQLNSNSINLGAPILNVNIVQSTQSTGSSTSNGNSVPTTYTNPLIQPVTPPTIVITQPVNSQKGGVTQQTIPYVTAQGGNTSQQTITVITTESTSGSTSNTVVISVICAIIGVVILSGVAAFIFYRRLKQAKTSTPKIVVEPEQEEQYEDQYHPNAGFDIFGKGDPFKKANEADEIVNDGDQDDQTDGEGVQNTLNRETNQLDNDPLNMITHIEQSTNKMLSVSHLDEELGVKQRTH